MAPVSARRHILSVPAGLGFSQQKEFHMLKHLSVVLLAGLSSAALLGVAQQPATKIRSVPIQPTSASSGPQMFSTYCAVCHGADGKGNGPAASALKSPATDLTMLSQRNGGTFPTDHVGSVLKFGVTNPAHGSADMPIWGDLMQTLTPASQNAGPVVHQRISNLIDYLKTIQK
jgi:mono/diheme cytochrome c family protein